jgi:hypothetical protein
MVLKVSICIKRRVADLPVCLTYLIHRLFRKATASRQGIPVAFFIIQYLVLFFTQSYPQVCKLRPELSFFVICS